MMKENVPRGVYIFDVAQEGGEIFYGVVALFETTSFPRNLYGIQNSYITESTDEMTHSLGEPGGALRMPVKEFTLLSVVARAVCQPMILPILCAP